MEKKTIKPPHIALEFFRWYCHPDLREEIEGDLLERFHKYFEQNGAAKAKGYFIKEVLLLFRPAIVGNIHHLTFKIFSDMKRIHWLQLIALNLLVILCIFLPFLPGPHDQLSVALSAIAQTTGFLGLLLVPVGILWLIQEIRRNLDKNRSTNNWSNGYYYAITAMVICILTTLFFLIGLLLMVGPSAVVLTLLFASIALYRLIPAVRSLRQNSGSFNAAPLYLLSVPLIAFTVRMFLIGPVSDYSRNYAIENGQRLISAIENYYSLNNHYPESIEELDYVPKPFIMGIEEFQYERKGNDYSLWFIQWQSIIATKEVVMYNKNDKHHIKGHYASFNVKQPHWKYYWLD